jgi:superoxide dismutase, Fe-Mn family
MPDSNDKSPLNHPAADRRSFLQAMGITAGVGALGTSNVIANSQNTQSMQYELPPLPYDYDALEPHIDQRIMKLHHDKHHQGYVDGANKALKTLSQMRQAGDFEEVKSVKRDLSFNLSGHVNHSVFWENMSPNGGGKPDGDLAGAIQSDFGSFNAFKDEFSAAAENVEGSGWGMLVYDHLADKLLTIQAENHNNRAIQGATPLLVLDVWEHAYYLQYENDRGSYIDAFWQVVNWDNVATRFKQAQNAELFDGSKCQ